jgi:hypothetical protein
MPLLTTIGLGIFAIIFARRRAAQTFQHKTMMKLLSRLQLLVIASIIVWTGPVAQRIAQVMHVKHPQILVDILTYAGVIGVRSSSIYMHLTVTSAHGFVDSVVWFTHPIMRRKIRLWFRRLFRKEKARKKRKAVKRVQFTTAHSSSFGIDDLEEGKPLLSRGQSTSNISANFSASGEFQGVSGASLLLSENMVRFIIMF